MGCFGFLKAMMFAFNGIIFVAGVAIMGVGIWVKVDSSSILGIVDQIEDAPSEINQILNVGYLLIAVGAVLLIIGFLGCCGAIKESRCMLLMFFVIVLVVFIAEVAGAVIVLVFKPLADDMLNKMGVEVVKNIQKEYGGDSQDITQLWNSTMETLRCCGFNNYTDFIGSPFYNGNGNNFPEQCCSADTSGVCNTDLAESALNTCKGTKGGRKKVVRMTVKLGCFPRLIQLIDENSVVVAAVALGIAALEVCAMIVSLTLYCKIGSKERN